MKLKVHLIAKFLKMPENNSQQLRRTQRHSRKEMLSLLLLMQKRGRLRRWRVRWKRASPCCWLHAAARARRLGMVEKAALMAPQRVYYAPL